MFLQKNKKTGRKNQRVASAILLVAGILFFPAGALPSGESPMPFHMALSAQIFPDVKDSDAIASIKVWGDAIFESMDMNMETMPTVYPDTTAIKEALRLEQTDLVAIRSHEFFEMESELSLDRILFYSAMGRIDTTYLLLVRQDGGFGDLASLKGKSLACAEEMRTGLGRIWFETILMQQCRADIDDYFESVAVLPKPSRALLSVFFGKADACLATQQGFETMVELNPQIGKTLKPIQVSPGFVPALLCLRKSYDLPHAEVLYEKVQNVDRDPKAAQVMTVFGVDKMVEGSVGDLATVKELMKNHARLTTERRTAESQLAEGGQ